MAETNRWFGAAELRQRAPFIVVGRSGFPAAGQGGEVPMPAISSTEVRDRIQTGKPVEPLVPRRVLDYIRERGLYGVARPL